VGTSLVLSDGSSVSVVGVVQDHVERGVDRPFEPSLYRPMRGSGVRVRTVVVKAATGAAAVIPSLQEAVWALDRDIPVSDVRTLDDWIVERVGGFRIIAELMGAFGVLSLVLGAVGIWGVTAYAVGRRTHEIGVRMAMGADRGSVLRMVVGQGARRVILGLVLGLALAVPAVGALRTLAVGVDPRDPAVFALVIAVLAGVSFLASWLPARRASGVDPVRALSVD
jgi:putative ABC transport system permease protein